MLEAIKVKHGALILINGLEHVEYAHVIAPRARCKSNVALSVVELVPSRLLVVIQIVEE